MFSSPGGQVESGWVICLFEACDRQLRWQQRWGPVWDRHCLDLCGFAGNINLEVKCLAGYKDTLLQSWFTAVKCRLLQATYVLRLTHLTHGLSLNNTLRIPYCCHISNAEVGVCSCLHHLRFFCHMCALLLRKIISMQLQLWLVAWSCHTWFRAIETALKPFNICPSYWWKKAASQENWHLIVDMTMLKKSCFCCVRFNSFSSMPRDWIGKNVSKMTYFVSSGI